MTANSQSSVGSDGPCAEQRVPGLGPPHFAAARHVSVNEGYKLWAPCYDRDPNPLLALEERELLPLLPSSAGRDVVDVACGTGRWLVKLLGSGARSAVGVDVSGAMIEVARTKLPPELSLKGHLVRADSTALPLRSESADLVVCSFAVGHFGDLVSSVRELARVARPGAGVFVTDLHPGGYARGWRTGFRLPGVSAPIEIEAFSYSTEQLRAAFVCQGLEVVRFLEARLGEPERAVFARAAKSHLFESACQVPAVLICQLRRLSSFARTA